MSAKQKWVMMLVVPAVASLLTYFLSQNAFNGSLEDLKNEYLVQDLESNAELFTQSFWNDIDRIKQVSLRARHVAEPEPGDHVLHWAEIEITGDKLSKVIRSAFNPSWGYHSPAKFEKRYFQSLKKRLKGKKLAKNGMSLLKFKVDTERSKDWLVVAFRVPGLNLPSFNSDTPKKERALLALVDPTESFALFKHANQGSQKRRAYLVGVDGSVLVHSQASYNGSKFNDATVFSEGVKQIFREGKVDVSISGNYRSIDQLPVLATIVRPGKFPVAIVVEQASGMGASTSGKDLIFAAVELIGFLFAAGLIFFMGFRLFKTRSKPTQAPSSPSSRPLTQASTRTPAPRPARTTVPAPIQTEAPRPISQPSQRVTPPAAPTPAPRIRATPTTPQRNVIAQPQPQKQTPVVQAPAEVAQAMNTLQDSISQKQILQRDAQAIASSFEVHAQKLADPKILASMLTQNVAQLAESPVIFFRHKPMHHVAALETDAGFESGREPVSLEFDVPQVAVKKIEECTRNGKLASLANYQPLSRMMLHSLNVACFEAWAITARSQPGRQAVSRNVLVGILVILNSGSQSTTHRESIVRLMRAAGRGHEKPKEIQEKIAQQSKSSQRHAEGRLSHQPGPAAI